jgi:hypothetical protein
MFDTRIDLQPNDIDTAMRDNGDRDATRAGRRCH